MPCSLLRHLECSSPFSIITYLEILPKRTKYSWGYRQLDDWHDDLHFKSETAWRGSGKSSMQQPNAFFLAYSPLIIPCFDVVRVYLHRVRNGKNPFLPDKNHIHHKMLAVGMRQRTVMIAIVLVSVCFTLCNILLSRYINVTLLLILNIFIWTLGNLWLTRRIHIAHFEL